MCWPAAFGPWCPWIFNWCPRILLRLALRTTRRTCASSPSKEKREEGEGEGRKRRDEEEEKRERGEEGREKRFFTSHFSTITLLSLPPFLLPFPPLHLSSPLPSEWTGCVTNLKKMSKAIDTFLKTKSPAHSAMGKREAEDRGEEGEGKQMRAERAEDQDQQVLRRFEKLIEKVGPENFRRLAEQAYRARTTGTHDRTRGESSTQDRTRQHA